MSSTSRRRAAAVDRSTPYSSYDAVEVTAPAPPQREIDAYGRFRAALATAAA